MAVVCELCVVVSSHYKQNKTKRNETSQANVQMGDVCVVVHSSCLFI
jgi:hypothetical protein